jgi:hypothetical protein
MILWNVSSQPIQTKFDGRIHAFAPGERKALHEPVEINHIIYKLEDYGLVSMPEGTTKEQEQKFEIEGLRKRRGLLDFRIRNFRTMNKEREAAKLSAEPPSDLIIETVDEINEIDEKLKSLMSDKFAKVDAFMKTQEFGDTIEKMDSQTKTIETSGSKVSIRKGGIKNAVSSTSHS